MTKYNFWLVTVILALGVAQPVGAVNIADDYWGANDHGYGDVISGANDDTFDIHSMDVALSGTTLTVTINTNYGGNTGHLNTTYGDLFLGSTWTPNTDDANYANDDYSNGTLWTYGFALDGRTSGGTTGTLYQLNGPSNEANTILSDSGGTFRDGQEVFVDTNNQDGDAGWVAPTVIDPNGSWSTILDTSITFSFDLSGTNLLNGPEIALHWAMSCANDTIEGAFSVPAPGVVLLLITGLVGFGVSSAAKRNMRTGKIAA